MSGGAGTHLMMTAVRSLDLSFPSEPGSVAEARMQVCDALAPELDEGHTETLRLLVSELVTNAVRHGGQGEPVELHAHWNSQVRIEVVDRGDGFTPGARSRAMDEPGGFGLFLVGTLADRWGVETDGATKVWFELETA
jgi:anti-sigma regulatory factor (Ser/Thr protein kinase)